jgi:hypothetical protein
MMESVATAVYGGRRIEGRFAVTGEVLLLQSEFGYGRCPLGGLPPATLAVMLLRDQARLHQIALGEA